MQANSGRNLWKNYQEVYIYPIPPFQTLMKPLSITDSFLLVFFPKANENPALSLKGTIHGQDISFVNMRRMNKVCNIADIVEQDLHDARYSNTENQ